MTAIEMKADGVQASTFKVVGRIFYGIGIAGIGLIHFVLPGFRPIMVPIPPDAVWIGFGYLVGTVLASVGIALILNKATRNISLLLGTLLILFILFGHMPNRLRYHPEILGMWTDAIKLMALAGGAFLLSGLSGITETSSAVDKWSRVARYGTYLFALMLILFGIDHFLYHDLVKSMVPGWIPGSLFWTYATGVALAGSGVAIFIEFNLRIIMRLLAIMFFLWLVLLHVPSTFKYPLDNGDLVISSFECLAFCGIALLVSKWR